MQPSWQRFYQPPTNPLARLGMALLGIGVLALSFVLGLVFLAIAVGLTLIGFVVLSVRRWLDRRRSDPNDQNRPIEAEYRVIDRGDDR